MKALFTFFALLIALSVFAQQNISDARSLVGQVVTVSGIVTNGNELGSIRYFQDGTAGLAAYGSSVGNVNRGDSVTITGTLKNYNNLLELDPVTSVVVHSSDNELPAAEVISVDQIGESFEGQLIQINKAVFTSSGGTFAGNTNYPFNADGKSGVLRISSSSPIVGQVIPTDTFNLVAICSQYSTLSNNVQTGYQLLPRDMDDFISTVSVTFTSPVSVQDISKNEFGLSWETDMDASSEVRYKLPGQSDWNYIKSEIALTSETDFLHLAYISGLEPASIVYAQPFSVFEGDTAFAPVGIYATQSNSSGEIKVYFNTEVDQTLSTGSLAENIGSALEDTLINYINRAQETIDFCIYNINNSGLSNVSAALNSAKTRGVTIRFITCGSTAHLGTYELDSEIPVLVRPEIQDGGIMHNKFAIFDASSENAEKPWVWTGSTNLTYDQINSDANNMVFIQDQTLAKTYQIEFEEMWGSATNQPVSSNAKFGADKTDNTPHIFNIGGNTVECYFSPSDNTNQKIIDAINTSDNDLEIETMLITRTDIANAIRDAKQRGVEVQIITNYVNDNTTTVNDILNQTLAEGKFVFDDNVAGILHNKLAIIDANFAASDPQVITGSHNWSNSANDKNDENILIIHNAEIANLYFQQFAERFTQNQGNLYVEAETIDLADLKIYPNPVTDRILISSSEIITAIQVYNFSGIEISEKQQIGSKQTEIGVQNLSSGIYLLKVNFKDGSQNSYKIIKQ